MMDPIQSIGQKLRGDELRDAIHIAILPVVCGEDYLHAGEEVGLVYGTTNTVKRKQSVYGHEVLGVIDPFLHSMESMMLKKGDVVWCFLRPGTITGLRHEWVHPALDEQRPPKNESEAWLRKFADKWNFNYNEMISGAQEDEGYVVAMGLDLHSRSELDDGDEALFWQHIKNLTGFEASDQHREKFGWSCSC
jgi:hypothetical protein